MAKKGRGGRLSRRPPVLADHRAVGKKRIPPLMRFPLVELAWQQEALPDFLWIAYTLGRRSEWWAVRRALDVIDRFVDEEGDVVDGRLSAFEFVPPENRSSVRAALEVEAPGAFPTAFGHAIGLFPDCAANWLYEDWLQRHTPDPTVGLPLLRNIVADIAVKNNVWSTRARDLCLWPARPNTEMELPTWFDLGSRSEISRWIVSV